MAKSNVESVRVRPNTHDENLRILREVQSHKKVDSRNQDELVALFDRINADCAARSLRKRRKNQGDKLQEETINAFHYGPLPGFPSGRWWGIRMDCSRDCIHEPFNENVHDGPYGALSVCTTHVNNHCDIDLGDILTFTSREYAMTDQCNDSLILSFKNRVPIRLVRGYCRSNKYAPKTGYRYDGLYTVVENWIGISSNSVKHRKFVLVRVLNQEPPPWVEKSSRIFKVKKSSSPRLTRSHSSINSQKRKKTKFVYNKVQKEPKENSISSIVSRQVFQKSITRSRENSPRSASCTDSSQNLCQNIYQAKLSNTNLSIRTNFYDSSHNSQDIKKSNMTFCKIYKPSQLENENSQEKSIKMSSEIPYEVLSTNKNVKTEVKKVAPVDLNNSLSKDIKNLFVLDNKDLKSNRSEAADTFITTKGQPILMCDKVAELPITESKSTNLSPANPQQLIYSKTGESVNEPSSSINSLSPDKLVNALIKEKYHPMAKLIIGNMIGLENQESAFLSAYDALTSKTESENLISSKSKLRGKFFLRSNRRKNGILKRQRREIANLMIDAKFDSTPAGKSRNRRQRALKRRISKAEVAQRSRRMPSRNLNKEICVKPRDLQQQPKKLKKQHQQQEQPKIVEVNQQRPRMLSKSIQCSLIGESKVNQIVQVGNCSIEDIRVKQELVNIDDIKEEFHEVEIFSGPVHTSNFCQPKKNYFTGSAFAAVNGRDNSIRIARLRSIGFRPISPSSSLIEECSPYLDVNEEYNKYSSEENDVVGYMEEQLHFEDIEEEEEEDNLKINYESLQQKTLKSLTDADFEKPWHGWKKVCRNGKIIWTGY